MKEERKRRQTNGCDLLAKSAEEEIDHDEIRGFERDADRV